ncbi:MAG: sporulation membrane protein YtaF [Cellulosilyticum sp.]|nr:sporulation membrane protein YtaF [Cellulosilyticum sp.]
MLESILLVLSLCVDACVASFAYGTNKIKIPVKSSIILTAISTLFLMLSVGIGSLFKEIIPTELANIACFIILFILGFMRLFEGMLKNYLHKKAHSSNNIEVTLFNFKLVLNVYADVTLADLDHSKSLSSKESLYLGIALSLDSLVVGLGAALAPISLFQVTFLSIIFHFIGITLGCFIGSKCAEKMNIDLSWLSGAILIALALLKIM